MMRFAAALVFLALLPVTARAEHVVITFEKDQGFPSAGGDFTGKAIPKGIVARWVNDSSAPNIWFTDDGPQGVGYPDAPTPISGKQIAGFGNGGNGVAGGTLELNHSGKHSCYSLTGFHWAYRGNGNSRPGGNAYLEVECFDLFGRSIGKERFQGGLNDDWTPRFTAANVKFPARMAISKIVFRGVPPNPENGSGTFFLDDVKLAKLKPVPMLWFVKGGKSRCTIVIPDKAPRWTVQAAKWLREYVEKASGAKLTIRPEAKVPIGGTIISIGHTQLAKQSGIAITGLKWDGCKLVVKGNVLYLLGRDNVGTRTHSYVGARGTCRAVITFLEDYCRVRWFLPGPQGEFVPRSTDIFVPRNLDQIFQPAFAYSDGRSVYDRNILDEPGLSLSALANNYRKAVKAAPGGHSYYHSVPTEKYFKLHPEYFAQINGKRTGKGNHLCSSHPEVRRLMVKFLQKRFDSGLDWVSIGQEDGYLRCQCPRCEKLDKYRFAEWHKKTSGRWETFQNTKLRQTPPERVFLLHKAVIDTVAESHPKKMVMLMCYGPTAWPSKRIPHFGENVIGELMNLNSEYINAWRGKVSGLAGFVYWFNTQCPMGVNVHMTPAEAANRLRFLHKNGFVAVSLDPQATWGLEGPVFYMMGRLMGDPSLRFKSLVEEYCHGVYGNAAGPMLDFFELLHTRLSQVVPIAKDDIAADARNTRLPRWMTTSEMYLAQYPPHVLKRLESLIQKAEQSATTRRTRGWVRLSRDQFDFIKLLTEMLISYRAWQAKPTRNNWRELKASVDTFEAYRLKIVTYPKEYTDVWFPGHGSFCKWLTGNLENTSNAYYVPWEKRKAEVMKKGLRGMPMGYGQSYYYSFIKEPLTLDFSRKR